LVQTFSQLFFKGNKPPGIVNNTSQTYNGFINYRPSGLQNNAHKFVELELILIFIIIKTKVSSVKKKQLGTDTAHEEDSM